jgi:predicted AAA+ superfamily ATPase
MIQRTLASKIRSYATQYPIVTITGPRQSGKTTLAKHLFPEKPYVSLEDLDTRRGIQEDPRGFLEDHAQGAVIDEAQYAPELFSYLQTEVDRNDTPGRFILTGSQQFEMLEKISQSLAGRAAIAKLLPLSLEELKTHQTTENINKTIYTGFYPRIYDKSQNPTEALSFYTTTYLERDVRKLINVTDLSHFETFLKVSAGRAGQLLNLNAIGNEIGVSHNTIKSWLGVLEASYVIFLLRPWHANLGKRLAKTPKLYFVDTGLACFLNGIHEEDHLPTHPLRGALFENLIVADAYKQRLHAGKPNNLYFYRDAKANEVDLIAENGHQIDAIEIKSSRTIGSDFAKGLNHLGTQKVDLRSKTIVYGGSKPQTRTQIRYQPWTEFTLESTK